MSEPQGLLIVNTRLMLWNLGALLLAAVFVVLTGCATGAGAKLPPATIAAHTVTEKRVFVPIEPRLTAHGDVAPAGRPSEAAAVAAKRAEQLLICYGQLDEIAAIQGTPVQP